LLSKPVNEKANWPANFELFVGTTVTDADADEAALAFEVAVTTTAPWDGTEDGAVYNPLAEIVPQADPEQPGPLTLHVTAVFVAPLTTTENCCWPPTVTTALIGEIVIPTEETTVTVAEAAVWPSALDVAVTVT
jgi:hypothetical protein